MNQEIKVIMPENRSEILWSDQVFLSFMPTGFVLDFAQFTAQMKTTRVVSRVGMSPIHAKMLRDSLASMVANYEKQFGQISISAEARAEIEKNQIGFSAESGGDGRGNRETK